jgi:hypothetical protein
MRIKISELKRQIMTEYKKARTMENQRQNSSLMKESSVKIDKNKIFDIIRRIDQLPTSWHGAGTVSTELLLAIARSVEQMDDINATMETGTGRTTLFFSHISENHLVFTLNDGNSLSVVKESPLLNRSAVQFVEGPSLCSLPSYQFTQPLSIVMLDGPHGYPFPDVEYYYTYPHIKQGGLLLIDDIKIPTIRRMFDIIRQEDMFELVNIIAENTAIFRRTDALCIDPRSDSWWLQGYNKTHYNNLLLSGKWSGHVPLILRKLLPSWVKQYIRMILCMKTKG